MIDPRDLERSGKGVIPCTPVDGTTLWREWLDSVRGRVGALLPVKWERVRSATQVEYRALYDAGMSAADAAAMTVRRWKEVEEAKKTEGGNS